MADENVTSLSLLQRIRAGDADGWRRVVELYTPLAYHWCRRWGVEGADADDILQEVFHAAAQGLTGFRREREGDTFRGWLRGITYHKVQSFWRSRSRQPDPHGGSDALQRLHELPDRTPDGTDDPDEAGQVSALFHRALALVKGEFEPKSWQAFWRVTVDGQSSADVAAELGMTANAVRMAKSRVLRRLREEVGELVE
jgi:RNA polymerase sigma-70 factor (ECF subfamily)